MTAFQIWASIFLILYLGWLLYLTIKAYKEPSKELGDFFLAGKSVKFLPSLLTFWATYFSAAGLIGAAGYYYIHGVGNFLFASLGYVILAVVAGTIGKRMWRMAREFPETRSPIQLYLKHYNSPILELLFVGVTLICMVPYLAAQITGFARMLESSLGLPYVLTAAVALVIIYIYSESGGLANIIKTDVLQASLTIVGCISVVVVFLGLYWAFDINQFIVDVDDATNPSLWSLPGPNGLYSPVTIIGLALLISLGATPMAHNAQRFMIVKEERYLTAMMYIFPFMGLMLTVIAGTLGLGGAAMFPGLSSGDQIIGEVMSSVPAMLGALTLVGVICATMSTADSILLSIGFIVSEHWYRGEKEVSKTGILRLNRWFTLAIAIFAFIASIKPELVSELAFNAFAGMLQLAPAMIAGIYLPRIGPRWAAISSLTGLGILVASKFGLLNWIILDGFPGYLAGFIAGCLIVIIAALFSSMKK
ncbi:sodium:solute symporter family protein [Opitutia bacterium ISCC 51]|nr:sodium:solute symporter family protein [Opitutae bacterium ISCC 51]QXD30056.1 sodium:solute symporter family protein [Opitutae bacterium ISCC 52]